MKNNVIPRTAKELLVTFKHDTSLNKSGDSVHVVKKDGGWVGKTNNGTGFFMFSSMVRNANVCSISVIG